MIDAILDVFPNVDPRVGDSGIESTDVALNIGQRQRLDDIVEFVRQHANGSQQDGLIGHFLILHLVLLWLWVDRPVSILPYLDVEVVDYLTGLFALLALH
jgi:hypothetical protein